MSRLHHSQKLKVLVGIPTLRRPRAGPNHERYRSARVTVSFIPSTTRTLTASPG